MISANTRYVVVMPILWLALLMLTQPGCAVYQFGHRSLYLANVATVHIPVFQSDSFRRNLGERLTEAVAKEIELKTPYKVVGDPAADSTLEGRLVADTKRVLIENGEDEPREIELNLQVQVRWLDSRQQVLREGVIQVPASFIGVNQASSVIPEIGESVATSQQEAIDKLATQIVALMEAPW